MYSKDARSLGAMAAKTPSTLLARWTVGSLAFGVVASLSLAAPLTAMAANSAPTVGNDHYKVTVSSNIILYWDTDPTVPAGLLLNDKDADGDAIYGVEVTPPQHGQIFETTDSSGHKNHLKYVPTIGYTGTDTMQYRVQDSQGNLSGWATITMTVVPHVAPVAVADNYSAVSGQPFTVSAAQGLLKNDKNTYSDYLKLSKIGASTSNGGLLDPNSNGSFSYTSIDGYVGTDHFTYQAIDSFGYVTGVANVTITVKPAPPLVVDMAMTRLVIGSPSTTAVIDAQILSGNKFRAGAPIVAYVDGKKAATKSTDATGRVKITVRTPSLAGKHTVKIVSGKVTDSASFVYGKSVSAKLSKLKTVKTKKTQTIKGSFGTKSGKITLRITDPKGKTVTKTVTLNSTGKFSYKYKVSSVKGTWTVRYSYRATPKYYGAKEYKATFRVK